MDEEKKVEEVPAEETASEATVETAEVASEAQPEGESAEVL